jgi:hypothetical protein
VSVGEVRTLEDESAELVADVAELVWGPVAE